MAITTLMLLLAATGAGAATEPAANSSAAASQPAPSLNAANDLYIQGYYERAVEQFEQLAADPGQNPAATLGVVRCRMITGDYEAALRSLESIAAEGERSADWLARSAELSAILGRYEQAIESARRAVQLDQSHYSARLVLGQVLETVGRRDEAVEAYRWFETLLNSQFPPTAEAVTATARGFNRYNVLTTNPNINSRTEYVLTDLLQVAYTRMDRTCWAARIAAADLLQSKYNLEEAAEDYKAALRINNNLPEAQVGLGRIALGGWDFEEAERRIEHALAVNPRCVPALALRAEQKITERRYAEAAAVCGEALKINPNDLRVLALAAGAALCTGDTQTSERMQAQAAAVNPRPAVLHAVLGDVLGGLRQYAASETHYRRAVEFDPTDANARCELGMMYMQWGLEDKAQAALDAAWALDQFNARTKNTLELLESLAAFATHETEHFILRYDAQRDGLLPRTMAGCLEDLYAEVCEDYGAHPPEKTVVEVFPTSRAFAVRITGKPWIFTIGACTGRIIALSSPRSDPALTGPYNFARVLRHEFTHTVTLAATQNRIPHWYTEGLAVLQEDAPRSFAWCQMLAERVRRDELFTLESIDWGFIRPKRPDDRQVAYAQSEWMCEYLVERFGYDVIGRMLADYRAGRTQEQVFVGQAGLALGQFDADFRAWARGQAAGWGFPLDPPENVVKLRALALVNADDAATLGRLARAEYDDGNYDKALAAARKALTLDENEKHALEILGLVLSHYAADKQGAVLREMEDEAVPALERLAALDPGNWTAPRLLAQIMLRREEHDEALGHLEQLQRNCPMDPFSYSALAGLYLDRDQPDLALPQLLELARTEEHDAAVPARIAAIYAQRDQLAQAGHWYRQALFIDPFRAATHAEYAAVLMRQGDTQTALGEYEVLCELQPTDPRHFANAALAYQKAGDPAKAKDHARKAVALDPDSPAKTLLE